MFICLYVIISFFLIIYKYMNCLIGGFIGLTIFVFELEFDDMGGIIFRINSDGKKEISPYSILEIMKAPFRFT